MPADHNEALRGRRILVVEDQFLLADLAQDILTEAGAAAVLIAANTSDALTMLDRQPPIDVAAIDVNLGGSSGFDLAEALVARGVPFIFVTGYGQTLSVPQALRQVPLLAKPYLPEALVAALAAVILSFPTP